MSAIFFCYFPLFLAKEFFSPRSQNLPLTGERRFYTNPNFDSTSIPERRLKPRIVCDCPARIQGHDGNGRKFEEDGRVVNLSRYGMYVLLNRVIPCGIELSIRMALPTGILKLGTTKLAVHGTVVRGELCSGTSYGIGLQFERYRFL